MRHRADAYLHRSVSRRYAADRHGRQARFCCLLGHRPAACPSRESLRQGCRDADRALRGASHGSGHPLYAQPALEFAPGCAARIHRLAPRRDSVDPGLARLPGGLGPHSLADARPHQKLSALAGSFICAGHALPNDGADLSLRTPGVRSVSRSASQTPLHGRCFPLSLRTEASPVSGLWRSAAGVDTDH